MKKQELKTIIKPLIKECLKEVLIEEGFAKFINESFKQPNNLLKHQDMAVEKNSLQQSSIQSQALKEAKENRKKMLDSIGMGAFDPFHGTQALTENQAANNLPTINAGVQSGDPGVDISQLLKNKNTWKQTLNAMKGKKDKE